MLRARAVLVMSLGIALVTACGEPSDTHPDDASAPITDAAIIDANADAAPPAQDARIPLDAARDDSGRYVSLPVNGEAHTIDPETVHWATCPRPYVGSCATVRVPLDWADPDGPRIEVFVNRVGETSLRHLWVLQGGPGGSVADFADFANEIHMQSPTTTVYLMEHRGVGRSTELRCDNVHEGADPDLDDLQECVAQLLVTYGTDLRHFNSTWAARDLDHLIESERQSGVPVFVYGLSYGTAVAQRYLHVAPTSAAGVILDSVVVPELTTLPRFDQSVDFAGQHYAEACALDDECRANLGDDPWTRLQSIRAMLKSGHCSASAYSTTDGFAHIAGMMNSEYLAPLLFAVMARLERCNTEDLDALNVLQSMYGPDSFDMTGIDESSKPTYWNIALSELWPTTPPTREALASAAELAVFPVNIARMFDDWWAYPTYETDAFVHSFPVSSTPLLILSGTLDAQTPNHDALTLASSLTSLGQSLVTVPRASHGVWFSSYTSETRSSYLDSCGGDIINQFLRDPLATLDTSCTQDVLPVSFAIDQGLATAFLGRPDAWPVAP